MNTWRTKKLKNLAQALTLIKDTKEMENFLRDLCTLEELDELSSRWEIVLMLNAGKTYREIAGLVGVSTTTVTRIAHWLNHGEGGYKKSVAGVK